MLILHLAILPILAIKMPTSVALEVCVESETNITPHEYCWLCEICRVYLMFITHNQQCK